MNAPSKARPRRSSHSWDGVADWYTGWNGKTGSRHHRHLAIPLALDLLGLSPGEHLVDLGCGHGVMATPTAKAGAIYTGVDLSPRLIATARRDQPRGTFHVADVTRLKAAPAFRPAACDAALFLLSIQDIDPLAEAITTASWLLRPGGRLVLVMLHPCFRVPRQSGWGWDEKRQLRYRRLDSYLSPLAVPMQPYPGGTTRSYHRPLSAYVGALTAAGLTVNAMPEITGLRSAGSRADRRAADEFPLLLGIRAVK